MISYRSIGAIAVMLFASAMMGIGVHHLLESGNCSTTGYTRFGPAPRCSSSATAWGIVLPVGLFVLIVAGTVGAPNLFVLLGPLFLFFGLGALTVSSGDGSSGSPTFALIFGGCFVVAGVGLLVVPLWSARSRRTAVSGRAVVAVAAWAAAVVLAFGVASLFPTEHASGAANQASGPSAFFQPPPLSADDPDSLYRPDKLARALKIAGIYLGAAGANVRSLRLVPGGVDVSVALGPPGLRGKEISVDDTGGYLSGPVAVLARPPRTYALSAIDPATPAHLAARLAAAGTLASSRIDHMLAEPGRGGGVQWLVYPVGGGPPYRAGTTTLPSG